jgi:hypothetical protein
MGAEAVTFRSKQEIVFGVGAEERVLEDRNFPFFVQLLNAIRDTRHPYGPRQHPLFRLRPERWLESLVVADVSVIDERLESRTPYSQVPAFSASDRAMLDVLTITHEGGWQSSSSRPTKISICRYRGSITGREWSGITPAESFPALDTSLTVNCRLTNRASI